MIIGLGADQNDVALEPFLISPIPSIASLIIKYHIRKNEHVSDRGKGEKNCRLEYPWFQIFGHFRKI